MKCQEEIEQDQEVRDLEQVEAWVEAVVVRAKEAVAVAREEVLQQALAVIASAPNVVKKQPMNWGGPAMSSDVLNAEMP